MSIATISNPKTEVDFLEISCQLVGTMEPILIREFPRNPSASRNLIRTMPMLSSLLAPRATPPPSGTTEALNKSPPPSTHWNKSAPFRWLIQGGKGRGWRDVGRRAAPAGVGSGAR